MRHWALTAACLFSAGPALAEAPIDLSRMSIEELSNVEITSVSKRPERLADAAASVFVLTNDDIRRAGVSSVAEAMRLAPNLNVQRVDSVDYAIAARGLNGFESTNKLLVLIDGRSVYSPFYSGVEWSQLHPDLLDLDRIEVVSGPGGTLWGANAVNGVINIVTRPADLTQGLAGTAAAGKGYQFYTARYGAALGEAGAFRIYGRAYERAASVRNGESAGDDWDGGQLGFRSDFDLGADRLTLQGDAYHDRVPSQIPASPEGKLVGQNVLGRWTHTFGPSAEFEVQAYYDRYERIARGILDGVKTYDIQAQQRLTAGRHRLVFGAGHRVWSDRFFNYVNGFTLDPPHKRVQLSNVFVQDQLTFDDLTLTLGVKAEHSSFSGTEWMPSARLGWRVNETTLLWGAVSRAVRNPSRLDRDLVFPPILVRSSFDPERLIAYELGYRGQPTPRLSVSATIFRHEYEGLRSTEPTPVVVLPFTIGNGLEGETWGVEAWGDFQVTEAWRLRAGFSTLGKDFRVSEGYADRSNMASVGHDPKFQAQLRSQTRLTDRIDLDARFRYVAEVPAERTAGYRDAPAYAEADVRLSWRVTDLVELSVAGFNLLDAYHPEATEPRRSEFRRNYQVALRYGW